MVGDMTTARRGSVLTRHLGRGLTRHPVVRALAVALMLVGCFLLQVARPSPAAAHNYLVSSTPSDGAVLDTAPSEVTLEFNGPVGQKFATVVVAGSDGTTFQSGAPRVVGGTVTQRVRPIGEDGTYRIAWRVVSSDGHPVSGTLEFQLRTGDTTSADDAARSGAGEDPASPSSAASSAARSSTASTSPTPAAQAEATDGAVGWLLAGGAGVAALAAGLAVAVRRRTRTRDGD